MAFGTGLPNQPLIEESTSPLLLPELPFCLAAAVFSLMAMVMMSPTWRARLSSNSGS